MTPFLPGNDEKRVRTILGLSTMAVYHSEKTLPKKAIDHHQRTTVFRFFQLNFYKTKVGSLTSYLELGVCWE